MIETMDMDELKALISSLLAEVQGLKDRVQELETENAELKRQLAQNSANSHKPPSSDGLAKKPIIKPALPKQALKKPGGQPGHPGKTLLFVEKPDRVHTHRLLNASSVAYAFRGRVRSWPADRCLTYLNPGSRLRSINS